MRVLRRFRALLVIPVLLVAGYVFPAVNYAEAFVSMTLARTLRVAGLPSLSIPFYTFTLYCAPYGARILEGRAASYIAMKDYSAALDDLNLSLQLEPKSADAWNARGYVHAMAGRAQDALRDHTAAARLEPDNVDALNGRAWALYKVGKPQEAVSTLDRAIALAPQDADALVRRGISLTAAMRYQEAKEDFKSALAINPNYADAKSQLAHLQNRRVNFNAAHDNYSAAIKHDPNDWKSWVERGKISELEGRSKQALADYSAALRINPQDTGTFRRRAWLRFENFKRQSSKSTSDLDQAIADLTESIRLNPGDLETIFDRGTFFKAGQRYADALTDVDYVIAHAPQGPDNFHYYDVRADIAVETGKAFDAIAVLDEGRPRVCRTGKLGSDCENQFGKARSNLMKRIVMDLKQSASEIGLAPLDLPAPLEAIALYTTELLTDPRNPQLLRFRGNAYFKIEKFELALQNFSDALALDHNDAGTLSSRGKALMHVERYDEALEDFTRAISLKPSNAVAYAGRAQVQLILNHFDQAIADYTEAIRLEPANPSHYHGRANAMFEAGRKENEKPDRAKAMELFNQDQ